MAKAYVHGIVSRFGSCLSSLNKLSVVDMVANVRFKKNEEIKEFDGVIK